MKSTSAQEAQNVSRSNSFRWHRDFAVNFTLVVITGVLIALRSDGHSYIQFNYAKQIGYNFGINFGFGSVGVSTPGGYSGIYSYDPSKKPAGSRSVKCFTEGSSLG